MKTQFIENEMTYDGSQLKSLFAYMNYGLLGDSVVSWIGPCNIPFDHMVDGEDLREQSPIQGDLMLHFIVEKFESSLLAAVSLQRLFASIVIDCLRDFSPRAVMAEELFREGDDIFWRDKKLSISIATISPNSSMIHFALNVTNEGTPVKTLSLQDLEVNPKEFAHLVMENFQKEMSGILDATRKVFWVQ